MAIVYLHKRKSDNTVFYVGITSGKKRPYTTVGRNYFWRKEVKEHGGFIVEIAAEDIDFVYALNMERDLVAKYGRRDLGLGTLVNLTDGGEGTHGFKRSEEMNRKQSESMKKISDRYKTAEFKQTMSSVTTGENNGMYNKNHSDEAVTKMKLSWTEDRKAYYREINSGERNPMFGERGRQGPSYENLLRLHQIQKLGNNPRARKVLQLDLNGNLIKEYSCIKEAQMITGISHIGDICAGRRKHPKKCNFKFQYKNNE